ncbi:Protein of uncharacterised function (DUF1493) [Serratia fonticola]|uniref:DUF1493 family protein n=1 Tax=Serratia fonticola TaxID=47917 RepID=UPI0021830320|nr:DUF1493 family protein [Serratia fonticola]CAI2160939.1 Protein of uncharacterised function (DUF1493) [Serratia fonticola]
MVDETEILTYLTEKYSLHKKPVLKEWTFQEHFNFVQEELEEMLVDLFTRYEISHDNFDLDEYFEPEWPVWLWWKKLQRRVYNPLTVNMIIESAKAGKWLYQ